MRQFGGFLKTIETNLEIFGGNHLLKQFWPISVLFFVCRNSIWRGEEVILVYFLILPQDKVLILPQDKDLIFNPIYVPKTNCLSIQELSEATMNLIVLPPGTWFTVGDVRSTGVVRGI